LQIDDHGVERAQSVERWAALGIGCAIEADDGQVGGGIDGAAAPPG